MPGCRINRQVTKKGYKTGEGSTCQEPVPGEMDKKILTGDPLPDDKVLKKPLDEIITPFGNVQYGITAESLGTHYRSAYRSGDSGHSYVKNRISWI